MRHDEHRIQTSICDYLDIALSPAYRYFAVPNGGRRDLREAARLKAEGVKAGVPDIVIVSQQGGWVAFIEVKKPGGSVSKAQREFRDWCAVGRIPWVVVKSIKDTQEALTALNIPIRVRIV